MKEQSLELVKKALKQIEKEFKETQGEELDETKQKSIVMTGIFKDAVVKVSRKITETENIILHITIMLEMEQEEIQRENSNEIFFTIEQNLLS